MHHCSHSFANPKWCFLKWRRTSLSCFHEVVLATSGSDRVGSDTGTLHLHPQFALSGSSLKTPKTPGRVLDRSGIQPSSAVFWRVRAERLTPSEKIFVSNLMASRSPPSWELRCYNFEASGSNVTQPRASFCGRVSSARRCMGDTESLSSFVVCNPSHPRVCQRTARVLSERT